MNSISKELRNLGEIIISTADEVKMKEEEEERRRREEQERLGIIVR